MSYGSGLLPVFLPIVWTVETMNVASNLSAESVSVKMEAWQTTSMFSVATITNRQ